jgi:hypothetical protein
MLTEEGTGAILSLITSYYKDTPMRPEDSATLLLAAVGAAVQVPNAARAILLIALIKDVLKRHPHAEELDDVIAKFIGAK